MGHVSGEFVMSTEEECLTAVDGADGPSRVGTAIGRFLWTMSTLAPALPSSGGLFNCYGRVYQDTGQHIELAAMECESPYLLALVIERQRELAARAVHQMAAAGRRLILANNNHSELLDGKTAVWGAHENYLVERHPSEFADEILPFLVTRVFAGAGGVEYPTGNFLAGVRPQFMERAVGGGTTEARAIHSTCREEHHMGPTPQGFRYHLILGDGHRSQFNLALQFGATALALKAIAFDSGLAARVRGVAKLPGRSWVHAMRRFNLLAKPGEAPRVEPLAVAVQRVYLDAARGYADSLSDPPAWIPRLLDDWQSTLDAMARGDRSWLAARLDTFAKYELYSAVLGEAGRAWKDLLAEESLFYELALRDHSYHEFCDTGSVFHRIERAGLLEHRVGERVAPGAEPEPWVPETTTRARARARFIKENTGASDLIMDWSWVVDQAQGRRRTLYEPFAREYDAWRGGRRWSGW